MQIVQPALIPANSGAFDAPSEYLNGWNQFIETRSSLTHVEFQVYHGTPDIDNAERVQQGSVKEPQVNGVPDRQSLVDHDKMPVAARGSHGYRTAVLKWQYWILGSVLAMLVVGCARTKSNQDSQPLPSKFSDLSAANRQEVESTLRDIADACQNHRGTGSSNACSTDLQAVVARSPSLAQRIYWPHTGGMQSFEVCPNARYGNLREEFTEALSPPSWWIIVYLRPEVLGNTRTAALTSDGYVIWITPEELTESLREADAFWARVVEALNALGG